MRKVQNIQALRGIAVISVVLFHLTIIEQKYGGTTTILPDFLRFGMFGVDLFFVISGFIMVTVTRGGHQDTKQALRFLYHRASRIYPTYWVYSFIVLAVFLINPALVNSSQGNRVDILASFLLLPSETLPLVMVGWTLIHEIYFYLIFFLVLWLVPERRMPAAVLAWGAAVLYANLYLEPLTPLAKLVAHPLTVEFIGGCFLAKLFFRERRVTMATPALLILASLGLIAAVYGYALYQQMSEAMEPQGWWRVLIFGLPAMLIVFCLTHVERNGFVIHSSITKIGDASYSIYLSHIFTLSAAGRVWGMFSSNGAYDNILALPALFMLAIIAGTAGYHLIEKPLLRLSRRVA